MGIDIDFSEVVDKKKDYSLIPEGIYNIEVKKVELKTSKAGNKYLNWGVEITDGEYVGRWVWGITTLKEDYLWVLKNYLEAIGISKQNINTDDIERLAPGKTARAKIIQDEYNDKKSNKVYTLLSKSDSEEEEMPF